MLLFPCSVYIKPGLVSFASCLLAPAPVSLGTLDYSRLCLHSMWSIPNPVGGWKGLYWVRWLGTVATELFVGLNHFPFSCFSTSLSILWDPPLASQAEEANGEVGSHQAPVSCSRSPTPPLHPPGPPWYPRCPSLGWGFLPCTAQRCHVSPSLLSSGKIHVLTSGQGHLKSHSTWTLLREVPPWIWQERRGKAKGTCVVIWEKEGETVRCGSFPPVGNSIRSVFVSWRTELPAS